MGLKIIEETLDSVDAAFHSLYTEKDGKFTLTGVDGMKTDADIARLQTSLIKERNEHKSTKEKIALLGGHDPAELMLQIERIPELEAAASGKMDDAKIESIVETRIKAKLSPIERALEAEKTKASNLESVVKMFQEKEKTGSIHSAVRKAALAAKVRPEAIEDAIVLAERIFDLTDDGSVIAKDIPGVTEGIDPTMWLQDLQSKKPHWWGETVGGGASGSGKTFSAMQNPWSNEYWNVTEQGKLYTKDANKAKQYAEAAGTSLGGRKPPKK